MELLVPIANRRCTNCMRASMCNGQVHVQDKSKVTYGEQKQQAGNSTKSD